VQAFRPACDDEEGTAETAEAAETITTKHTKEYESLSLLR
jgi:hypothetical protein